MKKARVTFIGGGNMADSLIGGLIKDGFSAEAITVSDPNKEKRQELSAKYSLNVTDVNQEAVVGSDVVVLAVKPQMIRGVALGIADAVAGAAPLVISIAAGIQVDALAYWLGKDTAIVRTMPNTPALVGSGATALYANERVSSGQHDLAESIMRAVGLAIWIDDEDDMDAVTALSGSGPAYLFLVMEAMEAAGRDLGLSAESARLLTLQTALGAARIAMESDEDIANLRVRVTSPGGTTERALRILNEGDLKGLFNKALHGAHDRARELSALLNESTTDE